MGIKFKNPIQILMKKRHKINTKINRLEIKKENLIDIQEQGEELKEENSERLEELEKVMKL